MIENTSRKLLKEHLSWADNYVGQLTQITYWKFYSKELAQSLNWRNQQEPNSQLQMNIARIAVHPFWGRTNLKYNQQTKWVVLR
jgi:hypothetical protein